MSEYYQIVEIQVNTETGEFVTPAGDKTSTVIPMVIANSASEVRFTLVDKDNLPVEIETEGDFYLGMAVQFRGNVVAESYTAEFFHSTWDDPSEGKISCYVDTTDADLLGQINSQSYVDAYLTLWQRPLGEDDYLLGWGKVRFRNVISGA